MSRAHGNAHERVPTSPSLPSVRSGDDGPVLRFATDLVSRGLGFTARTPELLLFVLLLTAAVAMGPVLGAAGVADGGTQLSTDAETVTCGDQIEEPGTYVFQDDETSDGRCLNIQSSDVTIDGDGHTITKGDHGDRAIYAGSYENLVVRNVTFDQWGDQSIFFDDSEASVSNVTVSNSSGDAIRGSSADLTLTDVTIHDASGMALNLDTTTVTATGLDIGASTAPNTTLDFEGHDLKVDAVDTQPEPHETKINIGRFFEATDAMGDTYLDVDLHYDDADVDGVDEHSMELARYDGSQWVTLENSSVDTDRNVVSGYTESFSDFGAFADEPEVLQSCDDSIDSSGAYVLEDDIVDNGNPCFYVDATDVTIDGNGHAIQYSGSGPQGAAIQTEPGGESFTIRNVSIDQWDPGLYLESDDVSVEDVTVTDSDGYGIAIHDPGSTLEDVRVRGSTEEALFLSGASVNATGFDLGDSTAPNTTLDFQARNILLDPVSDPAADPDGSQRIDRYFQATDSGSDPYLDVDLHYEDADADGLNESSLEIQRYDSNQAEWVALQSSSVDTSQNVVSGYTESFSDFGAFGDPEETFSECRTFEDSGTYLLENDISTSQDRCLEVGASDVTIDGQGHAINSTGADYIVGTTVNDLSDLTVRNVSLDGASTAIRFTDDPVGVTIADVTADNASDHLVDVDGATDVVVRDSVLGGAESDLLYALSATNVRGTNVTVADGGRNGSVFDFEGDEYSLAEYTGDTDPPAGNVSTDTFVSVSNVNGQVDFTAPYDDETAIAVDEETLSFFEDASNWQAVDSTVDTSERTVSTSQSITSTTDVGTFAEPAPYFDVTLESHDDAVAAGENATVTATVENIGEESGSQNVTFLTDGVERDSENVTLETDESTTVTLNWTTTAEDYGTYDAAVASEDDSAGWELTVVSLAEPIWETDADWNAGTHVRTVSDGVGDRRNDTVRLGYPADAENLTNYWPLDEDGGSTAFDVAGGYDGDHEDGVAVGQPGLLNSTGYGFDGTSRVNVTHDGSLSFDGDLAVSVWLRTESLGTSDHHENQSYFVDQGRFQDAGYALFDNGDHGDNESVEEVVFRVNENDQHYDVGFDREPVNDGEWHHIAGVRDGDEIRIYLDGELQDSTTGTSLDPSTDVLTIGDASGGDAHFEGDLDEVQLYDGALSDGQVQSLAQTAENGTHTTDWRTLDDGLHAADLVANATASSPTDANATLFVETDRSGDGTVDETSDPIDLADGTDDYAVENLTEDAEFVRLRTEYDTTDSEQTAIVDRVALSDTGPNFQVTVDDANDPIVAGETLSVNATVENVGRDAGEQTVDLTLDGGVGTVDETTVSLDAGESQSVSFAWETADTDAGEYEATVASENDSASRSVSVYSSAGPVWESDGDWNAGTHQRTVSDGVGDRVNDTVRLGYDTTQHGLVSYWSFDEESGTTAFDAVGGNDGAHQNDPTLGAPGLLRSTAYDFDGETEYVRVPDDESLDFADEDAITVSVWVQPYNLTGQDRTAIVQKSDTSYNLQLRNDRPSLTIHDGDTWYNAEAPETLEEDERYHLVGTYDGDTVTIYVDGDPVANESVPGTMGDSAGHDLGIARNLDSSVEDRHFNATFDELRIYDRGLSESEAAALYQTSIDGTHTSDWRSLDDGLNATDLVANATASAPTNANATLTVETDVTGDGTVDETSQAIDLADGTDDYKLDELTDDAAFVRLRLDFDTTDPEQTAVVDRVGLSEAEPDFQITVDDANDPIVAGETLTVNATVENVGHGSGEQTVDLTLDGGVGTVDDTTVALDAGESQSVSLSWETSDTDAGEYEATVASENDSDVTDVSVLEPANFSVAIESTNSPVVAGETLSVTANVTNVGEADGEQTVNLTVGDVQRDETTVALAGGENQSVTLSWTTGENDAGEYDATVASEDDSATESVTVQQPAEFDVSIESTNSPVVEGETLSVTANVTNTGDVEGTQNVTLDVDQQERDVAEITVAGGESTTTTLSWATAEGDVGDYTATVETDDDADSTAVRVDEPAFLAVSITDTNAPVVENETMSVNATVENTGDRDAEQSVNLSVDGDVDHGEVDEQIVSVAAGDATNVTLEWTTTEGDAGEYEATVASENDSDADYVSVFADDDFQVEIEHTTSPVVEGEVLTVNATVENLGDTEATQNVTLSIDGGEAVDETQVTLAGGENTSVSLDWQTEGGDAGDALAEVASEDGADAADVTVLTPASFAVAIDDTNAPVEEGQTLDVVTTVTNDGEVEGTQDLTLTVGGEERDRTALSLGSNETATRTLSWDTVDGDAGDYTATVASEDEQASTSVTVDSESSGGGLLPPPSDPEPAATLAVSIESTNSPVLVGESIRVTAHVRNDANETVTEEITLSARDQVRDAASVTLSPDDERTVELSWTTAAGDAGSHPVTVAGAGDSSLQYVDVLDEPAFDVAIESTNSPIDAGRPLRVTASVTANVDDEQSIDLVTGGQTVDSESVALAAGESTSVDLVWDTAYGDAGTTSVSVRSEDASASTSVELRSAATTSELDLSLEALDRRVFVGETGTAEVALINHGSQQTVDVVFEVEGEERDVTTVTVPAGETRTASLEWTPTEADLGERDVTIRAGRSSVSDSVSVTESSARGGTFGRITGVAGEAVDYEPTPQDTHVGGFLWLTALIGGGSLFLFVTRTTREARLLAVALGVAAVRTSTDVVHAAVEAVATEHLLALNTILELYVGLLFLAFAASYGGFDRLFRGRALGSILGIAALGTAVVATNPRHGLVFGDIVLADGPFTYATASTEPLGWVVLLVTAASLLAGVGLLVRSFLAGRNPAWRPVGVLGAGLCLAVLFVGMSILERGPLPQYDYTGAGVGGLLVVATTTAVGHGLHRIKHDAQKSLLQELDDPIVILTDAREVVEYNPAATELLTGIEIGLAFGDVVDWSPEWPAPDETTTVEVSRSELLGAVAGASDAPHEVGPDGAVTDGAGADPAQRDEPPADDLGPAKTRSAASEPATGDGFDDAIASSDEADESNPQVSDSATPGGDVGGDARAGPETRVEPHYLVQITSVTADTGDAIGYTVRFTDVTELKRHTAALERKNEQLQQVASTISHDLRNPLTVADGYVEVLQSTIPGAETGATVAPATVGENLEPVRDALDRMTEIIDDILALARSGDPASMEPLAFDAAVEEAWATVDTGPATLFVESDGSIQADPGHLRRMLENLFRNAVEHAGPDVSVLVGLTAEGFFVADDGPGIPNERRDSIFEQGETSNPQGTGLGLAIVEQLAHAQGWDVHLDDEYDGARFVVTGCDSVVDGAGATAGDSSTPTTDGDRRPSPTDDE